MWVRYAAPLHREREPARRHVPPALDRLRRREPVERGVQLDGVEQLRVPLEPAPLREPLRVEEAAPVPVHVAARPDADPRHPLNLRLAGAGARSVPAPRAPFPS